MNRILSVIRNNKTFIGFLFILYLVRGSIVDWHPVPTGSMRPTILEGDVIVESKIAYDLQLPFSSISLMRLSEPKRGDIIVFTSEASGKRLIKRLVGLPGDNIQVVSDQIIINGKVARYDRLPDSDPRIPTAPLDRDNGVYAMESLTDMEPHIMQIQQGAYNPHRSIPPVSIPEDHYFFMGDNRDNSADSRVHGLAPRSELRGRAFGILLSTRFKESWWKFRWSRFFSSLYE